MIVGARARVMLHVLGYFSDAVLRRADRGASASGGGALRYVGFVRCSLLQTRSVDAHAVVQALNH